MELRKKVLTLGLLTENNRILLGLKKTGFGAGRWNGFGGKVEVFRGETIEEAVDREFFEECGVRVINKEKRGVINFYFEGKDECLEVNIYRILDYSGEPEETNEMKPQWFELAEIPYAKMWADDAIWMPIFLKDEKIIGNVYFKDMDTILRHDIHAVQSLD